MENQAIQTVRRRLEELGSVVVAFSGGVDSSLLLDIAYETLGEPGCLAACIDSEVFTAAERAEAEAFCSERGIPLTIIKHSVFAVAGFADNPPERCYICKTAMLKPLTQLAEQTGRAAVVEGSNVDDLSDYRPGRQAVQESGVISPLLEAGLDKAAIRQLAEQRGLTVWDKPAQACLATRFAFGNRLTVAKLRLVEAAESYLHNLGVGLVRVRVSGDAGQPESLDGLAARIESDVTGTRLLSQPMLWAEVTDSLRGLGFATVSLDAGGYQRGAMNVSQRT